MPITIRYTFLTQILCIELELTVNKYSTLVRKNATEAADTPTKVCNKLLFKQKVPQCVDILNKNSSRPFVGKRVIGSFKR